jgi:hypothetical protein
LGVADAAPVPEVEMQSFASGDGGWLPAWVVDAARQPQLPTPGSFYDDDEMPQEPPAEGSWRAASVNSLQLVDGD